MSSQAIDSVKIEHQQCLKPEEMKRILQYIKGQFGNSDPIVICKMLVQQFKEQEENEEIDDNDPQFLPEKQEYKDESAQQMEIYPSRKTKWIKRVTPQQQKAKYEQQKFIAYSFCEHGINYHYITKFYPDMEPKTYRCYVEAVNNQTVNQIVDFLRYECNVQVERLNRDQKRSIRTQLTKIREWLGNRDMDQLQTFYKFIHRHYDKTLYIKFEDALKLYKAIIQIIKSPYVNVFEAEQLVRRKDNKEIIEETLTLEEEKAIIILFIKYKDLHKVSDYLCQTYGYDIKWSFHSVKIRIKELINNSINKILKCLRKKQKTVYQNYFDQAKRSLLNESSQAELKIKLLSFYLQKRTNYMKIKQVITHLMRFYNTSLPDTASEASLAKLEQTLLPFDECKTQDITLIKVQDEQKKQTNEESIKQQGELL